MALPINTLLIVSRLSCFLISIVLLPGCIDPISLEMGEPERRLVVEGLVREGPGPHYVILRRSAAYTQGLDALREAQTGATVSVLLESGATIPFPEVSPGRYEPAADALIGQPGESYTLSIKLADGSEYRSSQEIMLSSPEIANFYGELEPYTELINNFPLDRQALVLYTDAERTPDRTDYYRWTWRGTYAISVCGGTCTTCYRQVESKNLLNIGDDLLASGPILLRARADEMRLFDRLPAAGSVGAPRIGSAFSVGFHIVLEQQALSARSYAYWARVRSQRDDVGSLFDPPPENIVGNVSRVDDPTDVALGYFTVAGTSHRDGGCLKREQFQPEWPTVPSPYAFFGTCGGNVSGSTVPPPEWTAACRD